VLRNIYRNRLQRRGMFPTHARELLLHTEPFNDYPELVASMPDAPTGAG
jgi:hypothetical protein